MPARHGSGRKPLPENLKIIKGTFRKHRQKNAPANISEKKPYPPMWLNTRAKQIFQHMTKRLEEIGLASASYTETLALLSARMEEVERLDKFLNEQGYTYTTTNSIGGEVTRERPESKIREKAAKHVHSLLVEFGLSPSAIQRVGTAAKAKTEPDVITAFRNRRKCTNYDDD